MRRVFLLLLLFLLALAAFASSRAEVQNPSDWQPVAEGIEFQQFRLTNPVPVNVFVARMDRNNPNLFIESSIAQGRLSGGVETVSGMAARYDDALNFWGSPIIPASQDWGSTNDVVVAINGFYFGLPVELRGVPWSGQIHSGWYAKRFTDNESNSGFIWKMDRSVFIGGLITHPAEKQYVYIPPTEQSAEQYIEINGINRARGTDELILYTPQFDRDTKTDNSGTEVLVEMEKPTYPSVYANMPYGYVRKIRQNQGATPIPFDHVVLSGHGVKAQNLLAALQVGDRVGIAQRIVDGTTEPKNDWSKSYAGIGGHWRFLRGGVIYDYQDDGQAIVRDPRTAIAYNDQYIFFIVADGRHTGVSMGMTVKEMAEFAKFTLGATDAIMQDGGGSSTMVINGEVVNDTYCNNIPCMAKTYLPLVVKSDDPGAASQPSPVSDQSLEWDAEAQILQRLVANGMMMVIVQPVVKSEQPYNQGDPVSTLDLVPVYNGPGTNYAELTKLDGAGTITDPLNDLGGVRAKGEYWWKVDFGQFEGWVRESQIEPQLKFRSTHEFKTR